MTPLRVISACEVPSPMNGDRKGDKKLRQTSPPCSGVGLLALQGQVCMRQTGQPSRDQESAQKKVLFCVQDEVLSGSI